MSEDVWPDSRPVGVSTVQLPTFNMAPLRQHGGHLAQGVLHGLHVFPQVVQIGLQSSIFRFQIVDLPFKNIVFYFEIVYMRHLLKNI